jgi:WD40 repeat protein
VLRQKATGGQGKEETVLQSALPSDWSRDARFLLYATLDSKTKYDLWALPLTGDDRNPISIARTEFNERQGQFSPDTRWVAYVSDESGRPEVYVKPFPPSSMGSNKFPISQSGGDQPRWRRDGKELFYFSLDGKLMAVDVTSNPLFHAGDPKHLFSPPGNGHVLKLQRLSARRPRRGQLHDGPWLSACAPWFNHHSPFGTSLASSAAFSSQRMASVRDANRFLNLKSSTRVSSFSSKAMFTNRFSVSSAII